MSYADQLEALAFNRQLDASYVAREYAQDRREESTAWLAGAIVDEVVANWDYESTGRRKAWLEETADDDVELFLRDLLDDVRAKVDPTETILRRIRGWAQTVAEEEAGDE
jgi:hypothetical protein